jgi:hypothetical protein
MDIDGDDCLANPMPQITSSGGKSLNQSGVVVGPVVVEVAGFEAHAAAMKTSAKTKRIEQVFFILKTPCSLF